MSSSLTSGRTKICVLSSLEREIKPLCDAGRTIDKPAGIVHFLLGQGDSKLGRKEEGSEGLAEEQGLEGSAVCVCGF